MVWGVPKLVNGRGCSIFLRTRLNIKLPGESGKSISPMDDISSLPIVLVETSELDQELIGKAVYECDINDGLTSSILVNGIELNIPGGNGARTKWLRHNFPNLVWKGKYYKHDSYDRNYYKDRPFIGVPIKSTEGIVLGVIRVGDAVENKEEFSLSDLSVLKSCAAEVAFALEAKSQWYFLNKMTESLTQICEQNMQITNYRRAMEKVLVSNIKNKLNPSSLLFFCIVGTFFGCSIFTLLACFAFQAPFNLKLQSLLLSIFAFLIIIYEWRKVHQKERKSSKNT